MGGSTVCTMSCVLGVLGRLWVACGLHNTCSTKSVTNCCLFLPSSCPCALNIIYIVVCTLSCVLDGSRIACRLQCSTDAGCAVCSTDSGCVQCAVVPMLGVQYRCWFEYMQCAVVMLGGSCLGTKCCLFLPPPSSTSLSSISL